MTWQGSTRRARLPADWPTRRATVLERDGYRCVIPDCPTPHDRVEVDHRVHGDDHSLANLQTLCHTHHATKSGSEGGRARAARRGTTRRPDERHPGLK